MQFGFAFQRLLRKIFQAELNWGPVFLMKGDIANGFYQGCLRAQDLAWMGLAMPLDTQYREPLIAFPLASPMGWVEYPPFFVALYDTTANLGNYLIQSSFHTHTHHHDIVVDTNPNPAPVSSQWPMQFQRQVSTKPPVGYIDVNIYDFIVLAQGYPCRRNQI